MFKRGFVYIIGNRKPVLYVGVTANLVTRIYRHKHGVASEFTKRYNIHKLLYYEVFDRIWDAIKREKQLKNWHREWKINLIKSKNPEFKDLYNEILEPRRP